MDELHSISDRPKKGVSEEGVTGVPRIIDQRAQIGERKALAKNRSSLNCALVVGRKDVSPREDDALNRARQLAVHKIARGAQQLLEKQRIASSALDAFGRETLGGGEAPCDPFRLGRRERRKIDSKLQTVAGRRPPARVERIGPDSCRHDDRRAASRRRPRYGGKQRQRLWVSPMDVLDRHEKRIRMSGRLDQIDEDALLGAGARRSIDRLVKRPVILALRNFEEVTQIEGVVARRLRSDDGDLHVAQRGVSTQAE